MDPEKKALHTIILTKKKGDDKEVLAEYKGRSEKVPDTNLTNCRHFQSLSHVFWAPRSARARWTGPRRGARPPGTRGSPSP